MEYNKTKVHLPWYARGTPVSNPRDGPAEAIGAKPPFAARNGPPARGKSPDVKHPWPDLILTINASLRTLTELVPMYRDLKNVPEKRLFILTCQLTQLSDISELALTTSKWKMTSKW